MPDRQTHIATESSVLTSSSAYLNHPGVRAWFETHLLRKNGADYPVVADNAPLSRALNDLRDKPAVQAMFDRDRQLCEPFDRWLSEGFISTFTVADLARCPEDSVGGIYYRTLEAGYEIDVGLNLQIRDSYEYAMVRYTRNHDFEHILTGGPFTYPGETVVTVAMTVNTHNYLSPDLAAFIGLRSALASQRHISRAALHYPGSMPGFLRALVHGISVGLASAPIRLIRVEDVLALPVEEARQRLGIVATDLETEPWASKWLNPLDRTAMDADKDTPYIRRGVKSVPTGSSTLVSSSRFLNDPRLREWTAVAMLRRAGADYPDRVELRRLEGFLEALRDRGRANALAEKAFVADPALRRMVAEPLNVAVLAACPGASVGGLLLRRLRDHGDLEQLAPAAADAWTGLWRRTALAEQALAVILGAGGHALDHIMPAWAMISSLHERLDPELAGELTQSRVLGLQRYNVRTQLHYPKAWIAVARALRQGILIGQASCALHALAFEDVLDMTPAQAREHLGIVGFEAVDMRAASEAYCADQFMDAAE